MSIAGSRAQFRGERAGVEIRLPPGSCGGRLRLGFGAPSLLRPCEERVVDRGVERDVGQRPREDHLAAATDVGAEEEPGRRSRCGSRRTSSACTGLPSGPGVENDWRAIRFWLSMSHRIAGNWGLVGTLKTRRSAPSSGNKRGQLPSAAPMSTGMVSRRTLAPNSSRISGGTSWMPRRIAAQALPRYRPGPPGRRPFASTRNFRARRRSWFSTSVPCSILNASRHRCNRLHLAKGVESALGLNHPLQQIHRLASDCTAWATRARSRADCKRLPGVVARAPSCGGLAARCWRRGHQIELVDRDDLEVREANLASAAARMRRCRPAVDRRSGRT